MHSRRIIYLIILSVVLSIVSGCNNPENPDTLFFESDPVLPDISGPFEPSDEVSDLLILPHATMIELTWKTPLNEDYHHVMITWIPATSESQPKQIPGLPGVTQHIEINGFTSSTEYTILVRTVDTNDIVSQGLSRSVTTDPL